MYLIVGLGNVGSEYELTRHNYGFLLLDQIIQDYKFIKQSKKFNSEIFVGEIDGEKIIAIKPQTLMNLSGAAVASVANFYKIPNKNILVFHDDLDIELGKIKMKIGGGDAGHNGLKSIDSAISKDYLRLRLGIGRPENKEYEISNYVLGRFSSDELKVVEKVNKKISDLFDDFLSNDDISGFLNKFYR